MGRAEVEHLIGKAGKYSGHIAWPAENNKTVLGFFKTVDMKENLLNEAHVLAFVRQSLDKSVPVPRVLDVWWMHKKPSIGVLVMDTMPGTDLWDCIVHHPRPSPRALNALLLKIVHRVHCLHDIGVAHMDLKPENIMVSNVDNARLQQVALVDYGFAVMELRECLGVTFREVSRYKTGTASFRAPEVLGVKEGHETDAPSTPDGLPSFGRASLKADAFSLGRVINEVLKWKVGSEGRKPQALCSEPGPWKDVMEKMVLDDPSERMSVHECFAIVNALFGPI